MTSNFFQVIGFLTLLSSAAAVCPLCETPADLPVWWQHRLPDGRTCQDIYLFLASYTEGDAVCQAEKAYAQQTCCSEEEPDVNFSPTSAPIYNGPFGDEPDCPICGTLEFPGIPNAFIVARYVGEFTCEQLYHRGLNGMTPGFMCGPLQDFAEPVCGCGQYNPNCRDDPTQCWDYTPAPVTMPVSSPTPAPVYVAPTILSNRKTPPEGGKYNNKLSGTRGGAASRHKGRRLGEKKPPATVVIDHPREIDSNP